jgi:hypothetical protein
MKYYKQIQVGIIILFIIVICTWLNACESFTTVELPQSQLTGTAVFEDVTTATAALSNCYAQLRESGMLSGNQDGLSNLMGNYSDELTYYGSPSSPVEDFYNHTVLPSNAAVSTIWNMGYNQIYAVNAILEGLENATAISSEDRNRLKGEASFLRAFLHFYMLNLYGDIPYVNTTSYKNNSTISRMPENLVYQKIIADIIQSKTLLTDTYTTTERIRPNKAAVCALLARVSLYTEKWQQAEEEATAVINNTAMYHCEADLDKVFLKESPSVIWQLHPGISGLNTHDAHTFIFSSGPPPIAAVSDNLLNAFENGDERKSNWLGSVTDGTQTWYYPYKYKQIANTGTSQEYAVVFRLEEQYLIRAEARAHQNNLIGAKEDLNVIRHRAGLADTNADTPEKVLLAIFQERRVELFTELGQRWFDLKRTAQADAVLSPLKPGWKSSDKWLPVPATELLLNKNLHQNAGY